MSESDSFLHEVSEELRRDQLVATLRKNAVWIALVVIVAVGGAAYFEWSKASNRAEAEGNGSALWAAVTGGDAEARLAALQGIEVSDAAAPAATLQLAAAQVDAGDVEDAVTALQTLAADPDLSAPLRDAVRVKLAAISGGVLDDAARLDLLERMAVEGHAMRPLALEIRALIRLEAGDVEAARADLAAVTDDPLAPQTARARADQLLTALGAGDGAQDR